VGFYEQVSEGALFVVAAHGVAVTYRRGLDALDVTALRGRNPIQQAAAAGMVQIQSQLRDYLIPTASLVLAGSQATPAVGDRIVDGTEEWEVAAIAGGPGWEWAGASQELRRVHTKKTDSDTGN
jgi:hypothetical protein